MKTTLAILGIVAAFAMITATMANAYATDPVCCTPQQQNNQNNGQVGAVGQTNNIGGGTFSSTHNAFSSQTNNGALSQTSSQLAANLKNTICSSANFASAC